MNARPRCGTRKASRRMPAPTTHNYNTSGIPRLIFQTPRAPGPLPLGVFPKAKRKHRQQQQSVACSPPSATDPDGNQTCLQTRVIWKAGVQAIHWSAPAPGQRLLEDQDLFQYNLLRAGTRAKCLWTSKQQSSCGNAIVISGGRMQITDKWRGVKVTPRPTLQAPILPHLPSLPA